MKKLLILTILFLVSSCSDVSEEATELDKCIDANIKLMEKISPEELAANSDLHELKVMIDVETLQTILYEQFGNASDTLKQRAGDDIETYIKNLSDRKKVLTSFKHIADKMDLEKIFTIYTDKEEIYFTVTHGMTGKETYLRDIVESFERMGPILSEDDMRQFKLILQSTIGLTDRKLLVNIAEEVCWSQGIY